LSGFLSRSPAKEKSETGRREPTQAPLRIGAAFLYADLKICLTQIAGGLHPARTGYNMMLRPLHCGRGTSQELSAVKALASVSDEGFFVRNGSFGDSAAIPTRLPSLTH
jgi:hypothetical protein